MVLVVFGSSGCGSGGLWFVVLVVLDFGGLWLWWFAFIVVCGSGALRIWWLEFLVD